MLDEILRTHPPQPPATSLHHPPPLTDPSVLILDFALGHIVGSQLFPALDVPDARTIGHVIDYERDYLLHVVKEHEEEKEKLVALCDARVAEAKAKARAEMKEMEGLVSKVEVEALEGPRMMKEEGQEEEGWETVEVEA